MRDFAFLLAILLHCLASVGFAETQPRLAEGFHKLDDVLVRAGGVRDFLASTEAREEYLRTLQQYGSNIEPGPYHTILKQLEDLLDNNPELEKHLMSQNDLGQSMRFESTGTNYGRGVDTKSWRNYLTAQMNQWKERSRGITSRESALAVIEDANNRVMEFGRVEQKSGRDSKIQRGKFLDAIKSEEKVKGALSFLALEEIERRNLLQETHPNKILAVFESLRVDPTPLFSRGKWTVLENETVSFAKSVLPSAAELLSKHEIFPPLQVDTVRGTKVNVKKTLPAVYDLIPIPRRFHSIFKAFLIRGECIGGSVCGWTIPARWGTGVVPHSDMSIVYKDKVAMGYVHTVPLSVDGKEGYRSIDLVSHAFFDRLIIENQEGKTEQTTLFDLWLQKSYENQPEGFRGYVIGQSGSLLPTSEHTGNPAFYWGPELSDEILFEHDDPVARALSKNSKTNKYWNGHGIVTDATVYDQRGRGLLLPPVKAKELEARFPELSALRKKLAKNEDGQLLEAEGRKHLFSSYAKKRKFDLLEQYYLNPRNIDDLPLLFEGLAEVKEMPQARRLMIRMLEDATIPQEVRQKLTYTAQTAGVLLERGKHVLFDKVMSPTVSEAEQATHLRELVNRYQMEPAEVRQLEDLVLRQKASTHQTNLALILREHEQVDISRFASLAWEWTKSANPRVEQFGWSFFRRLIGEHDSANWQKIRESLGKDAEGQKILEELHDIFPALRGLGSCSSAFSRLLIKERSQITTSSGGLRSVFDKNRTL